MSSNDKTRQKLVSSMRKTKSGTGKNTTETKANGDNQKPVKSKTKKPEKNVAPKDSAGSSIDLYQSGRRIWPD